MVTARSIIGIGSNQCAVTDGYCCQVRRPDNRLYGKLTDTHR